MRSRLVCAQMLHQRFASRRRSCSWPAIADRPFAVAFPLGVSTSTGFRRGGLHAHPRKRGWPTERLHSCGPPFDTRRSKLRFASFGGPHSFERRSNGVDSHAFDRLKLGAMPTSGPPKNPSFARRLRMRSVTVIWTTCADPWSTVIFDRCLKTPTVFRDVPRDGPCRPSVRHEPRPLPEGSGLGSWHSSGRREPTLGLP